MIYVVGVKLIFVVTKCLLSVIGMSLLKLTNKQLTVFLRCVFLINSRMYAYVFVTTCCLLEILLWWNGWEHIPVKRLESIEENGAERFVI